MKIVFSLFVSAGLLLPAANSFGQTSGEKTVVVGGAPMYPSKDIIDNALQSKDHTTLVTAVKAGGLVSTLKGAGPFTVFAPTNEGFTRLPDGVMDNLLKPENKDELVKVLTYHVLAGRIGTREIRKMIRKGHGKATLTTIEGGVLTATADGPTITLVDDEGNKADITISDVWQKNGVIQVINGVLLPK